MLLVLDETALVGSTVSIDEVAIAMHLVIFENACVMTAVRPGVLASAFHLIGVEGSFVA